MKFCLERNEPATAPPASPPPSATPEALEISRRFPEPPFQTTHSPFKMPLVLLFLLLFNVIQQTGMSKPMPIFNGHLGV